MSEKVKKIYESWRPNSLQNYTTDGILKTVGSQGMFLIEEEYLFKKDILRVKLKIDRDGRD